MEFALVVPILMTLLGGMVGIGYLYAKQHEFQNGVDVLAQVAATDPSGAWHERTQGEADRTGCAPSPLQPDVSYPDGTTTPGSRLLLTWHCHLQTGWLFDGLTVTVASEAVIPINLPPSPPAGGGGSVTAAASSSVPA